MTAQWDVDLETERVQLDGNWLTREELSGRIQQMLASGDFKISRHSEALEHLATALTGARALSFKLTSDQYARLEAAAQKAGKPAAVVGRELLLQVLAAPSPAATGPSVPLPPLAAPSPAATGPSVPLPPPATSSVIVSAEPVTDEAPVIAVQPKRKDLHTTTPPGPPVMTPVAQPTHQDGALGDDGKVKTQPPGASGEARRWFNRS